jgi:signal transduction histidine kinase
MPPIETLSYRVDRAPAGDPDRPDDPGPAAVLRRVAAGLAHNVNNSLTGVIAYLELALREADPGTPLHERLTDGLHCALRLAERVRRIVRFARRPGAGDEPSVCLHRTAAEAVRRAAADRPGLRVVLHAAESPCPVRADGPLLCLVLEQIVSDAAAVLPDGGTLALRAWVEGRRRCLSVAGPAPALTAEVRRHLAQPLGPAKSFGHPGIGLALCRDVIEAQGGALHLTTGDGRGTTVTLSFPPPDEGAPAGPTPPPLTFDI